MPHRPSLMLDRIEDQMERIIAERSRIRSDADQARLVVEAFETRADQ